MKTTIILATAIFFSAASFAQDKPASVDVKTSHQSSGDLSGGGTSGRTSSAAEATVSLNTKPAVEASSNAIRKTRKSAKQVVTRVQQTEVPAKAIRINAGVATTLRIR